MSVVKNYKEKKELVPKEKPFICPICKERFNVIVTGDLIEFIDKNDNKKAQVKGTFYEGVTIECFKCGTYLIFTREELVY